MQSTAKVWKGRAKQFGGRLCRLWGRATRNSRREFIGDLIIVEGKLEEYNARRRRERAARFTGRPRSLHVVV